MVIFVHRPDYLGLAETPDGKETTEIIIAKHRNGETADIPMRFKSELVRFVEIPVVDIHAFRVMFVLPEIPFFDAPAGIPVFGQKHETFPLFIFADLEEEFDHQISVVGELSLKTFDAGQMTFEFRLFDFFTEEKPGHLVHPASVEERVFAALRDSGTIPG